MNTEIAIVALVVVIVFGVLLVSLKRNVIFELANGLFGKIRLNVDASQEVSSQKPTETKVNSSQISWESTNVDQENTSDSGGPQIAYKSDRVNQRKS